MTGLEAEYQGRINDMTTPNYPFNFKPDIKEANHLFRDLLSNSGDMLNTLMKLQVAGTLLPDSEKLSPDFFGCEKFFIDFFVNADMGEDFRLIARDFFQHEYTNLDKKRLCVRVATKSLAIRKYIEPIDFTGSFSDQLENVEDAFAKAKELQDLVKDLKF
jgi:hypothetical protein